MLSSMAYTPGRGRLAAMERLLSSGSSMEPSSAEEAIRERLAAQVIQKEMDEADEANLLEEEDMHVFEWKPLTDPLNLVSCKTCKKPIKASQYAAHAERCKSLSASDDTGLELDGGTGHKRPPRKVRKKVQTTHENQTTAAGDQEISESFDGEDTCASESANVDDCHMGIASSLSREVKKSPMLVDGSLIVDGSGSASYSEGAMSPSKRAKLLPVQSSLTSDNSDSMCGVTMESGTCCQGPLTCKLHSESSKRAVKGRRQVYDVLLEEHNTKVVHGNVPKSKDDRFADIPAPLATKIYYPRQNQRLRAVLGHLYQESLKKENSNEPSIPKPLSGDAGVQSGRVQILPPDNDVTDQQKDLMGQKKQKELSTISSIRKSEQMLPPTSEIGRSITNGHPSHMNFQNQYHENKFARSQLPMEVGPAGIMRNRFIQTPYTFTGNAGTSMGSMQQANGIVPVI
ncbi:SCA7 domain-containing protein SELMODRAFT_431321 isoform X3 [Cryptomeria japonica]|uniref:SCA7 domain-containing protein SELMODRAFT_431321 isoform X3 n=1 Tax=Cryptomeria japonica TaxID=3369 RepID=UPI0027DA1ABA|nr:SCA7 domain-containing protein SELMODRAFT_431321 isoform X3 [Cryptomeria japonica]